MAASKLHKHRGTCYTAEWPYCPFAILGTKQKLNADKKDHTAQQDAVYL